MNQIIKRIEKLGILPVIVMESAEDASWLGETLCKVGLTCAEVTFRTKAAEKVIKELSGRFPKMIVGAGTVLSTEQVEKAINAGAQFIVSPGFDENIVKYCLDRKITVVPGVCTPSDIQKAYSYGLNVIKFFPAEITGGLPAIKALAAPYPMMRFIPTGGITLEDMHKYLEDKRVLAVGGSFMVKPSLIVNRDVKTIESLTKESLKIVHEARQ